MTTARARAYAAERNRLQRVVVLVWYSPTWPPSCACCGRTDDLCIDHVDGDGEYHRWSLFGVDSRDTSQPFYTWLIRSGFPDDPPLQVLCHPCNTSKRDGERCQLWHGDPAYRRCRNCLQVKPLAAFARDSSRRGGLDNRCRACRAAYHLSRTSGKVPVE